MKRWIIFLLLFLSLGFNIAFVSMLAGKKAGKLYAPARIVMHRLDTLPEPERSTAKEVFLQERAKLKSLMGELKHARKETFAYIASPDYERAEAQRRLTELREKTAQLQDAGQTILLDIADGLSPESRAVLLQRGQLQP